MTDLRKVLIIGGGITGLTAAAALAKHLPGLSVDLVEINPKISDLGGVGLSIVANASRALNEIGVAEQCFAAGMPGNSVTIRNAEGKEIVKLPTAPPDSDWPGATGIGRAAFHAILADAARAAGTNIRCGLTAERIEEDEQGAHVHFTDGSDGHYDLVLGADGLFSHTRAMLFPNTGEPRDLGQGIWRAWAPRPKDVVTSQLHVDGPQGLVGVCPISDDSCYIYCLHNAEPGEWHDPEHFVEELQEKLQGYGGMIPEMAKHITDPTKVNYRPLQGYLLDPPWYRGRVLLIGDAAHVGPPTLAQGAAMGIEDAVVLAEELASGGDNLHAILDRFTARRLPRVRLVYDVSCQLARAEAEHDKSFNVREVMQKAGAELMKPY